MKKLSCLLLLVLVAAACGGRDEEAAKEAEKSETTVEESAEQPASDADDVCDDVTLEATDIGITEDTITIQVMADVGSQFAPGLFQGAVDGVEAYAEYVNDNGGIACRDLEVEVWDSALNPEESKNGLIEACRSAFAKVGGYSIFNPDLAPMTDCVDAEGEAIGQPNVPALSPSEEEICAPTTYSVFPKSTDCPWPDGVRSVTTYNGMTDFYVEEFGPDLHGMFLAAATTPAGLQGSVPILEGIREAGMEFDSTPKVAPTSEQSALTPVVQRLKQDQSNFVYNGSADSLMIKMRKEAAAQGLESVRLWACSLSCYSDEMRDAGSDVDGTYVWLSFLPFEEADTNEELASFMEYVGDDKADAFGAQAWQAAGLFKHTVERIVERDGPNALTRASLLEEFPLVDDYDANGWMGTTDDDGEILCSMHVKLEGGEFERVHPEERGTLDCSPGTVTLDLDVAKLAEAMQ